MFFLYGQAYKKFIKGQLLSSLHDIVLFLKKYPKEIKAFVLLSTILIEKKKLLYAKKVIEHALRLDPSNLSLLIELSRVLFEQKEYSQAVKISSICLEKRPQDPLIQKNHLLCLYESGQHQAFLQQLVHTQYHDDFSLIERGFNLYLRFYHFSKAKKMITDNLLLLEKIHYKHFLYSKYYLYKRQLKKSYFHLIEAHKEGLSLDPYLDLLAKIYKYTKRIDKSFETLTRHYAYSHSNESLFDQAILLLSTGKSIAKAWSLYQSRHRLDRFMRKQAEKHLTYTYTPLIRKDKNTRIALVPEQGLGDAIFSLRFLTTCSSHTSKITLFERKELYPLLKSHAHLWKIDIKCFTNFSEIAREQFDYHASLLDLPYLLQINSVFPKGVHVPYIYPEEEKIKLLTPFFSKRKGLQVGLCWRGNPDNNNELYRSFPLKAFQPLFEVPYVNFYSFHKGYGQQEIIDFPLKNRLHDFSSRFYDFSYTAAAISHLDLIITSCTSLAHLAAAIGKPTWLLVEPVAFWTWGTQGEKSPWYPNVRIFRQKQWFVWKPVIDQVKKALFRLV